jgi:hypothetical protein
MQKSLRSRAADIAIYLVVGWVLMLIAVFVIATLFWPTSSP